MRHLLLSALLVASTFAACNAIGGETDGGLRTPVQPATVEAKPGQPTPLVDKPSAQARVEDEQNTIDVFRAAAPATVFVTNNQLLVDRFTMQRVEVPAGSGT